MDARQMQIEFERLVQLANPKFEYLDKIDSDTIFYFINAAQERFITQSFVQVDSVSKDTYSYNKLLDVCKALITTKVLSTPIQNQNYLYSKCFELPDTTNDKFYTYLSSYSTIVNVNDSLEQEKIANNKLISAVDVNKILVTNTNSPILRTPCAVLNASTDKSTISIYYDKYTVLKNCCITYIRKPLDINIITGDGTTTQCELDSNVHRELVEMAVDMFIREGVYRLSANSSTQQNKQTNNDNQ